MALLWLCRPNGRWMMLQLLSCSLLHSLEHPGTTAMSLKWPQKEPLPRATQSNTRGRLLCIIEPLNWIEFLCWCKGHIKLWAWVVEHSCSWIAAAVVVLYPQSYYARPEAYLEDYMGFWALKSWVLNGSNGWGNVFLPPLPHHLLGSIQVIKMCVKVLAKAHIIRLKCSAYTYRSCRVVVVVLVGLGSILP